MKFSQDPCQKENPDKIYFLDEHKYSMYSVVLVKIFFGNMNSRILPSNDEKAK